MRRSTITITFREDWDPEGIAAIVKDYALNAVLDVENRKAFFKGASERGQEFVRAVETVEPIKSLTLHTVNQ